MVKESNPSRTEKRPIVLEALRDLLKDSLLSSPIVSVGEGDLVAEATNLLPHNLETFTDSLVVVRDERPVGLVGGLEILDNVLERPSADLFYKTRVGEIMSKNLTLLGTDATLGQVLLTWMGTGRAFAIMPNEYHGFSAISARRLLEVGMAHQTQLKVRDISRKKIMTFRKEDKISEIIQSMFANWTRKLILEGTSEFISDRIIIQKISRELNCLQGVDDFLEMQGGEFRLDKARKVDDDTPFNDACKLMYDMQSPYLMLSDGVVTPWDAILVLRLVG